MLQKNSGVETLNLTFMSAKLIFIDILLYGKDRFDLVKLNTYDVNHPLRSYTERCLMIRFHINTSMANDAKSISVAFKLQVTNWFIEVAVIFNVWCWNTP